MTKYSDMPVSEAIKLYHKKHHALKEGNISSLIVQKSQNPELFDKAKDAEMWDLIEAIEMFRGSSRYQELRRQDLKEQLFVISNDAVNE